MNTAPIWVGTLLACAVLPHGAAATSTIPAHRPQSLALMEFVPNAGQWPEPVRFGATRSHVSIWFSPQQVIHQVPAGKSGSPESSRLITSRFIGADPSATFVAGPPGQSRHHFFFSHDPEQWVSNVVGLSGLELRNIYPGVDITYYSRGGQLEYDLILHPGANLSDVEIEYAGIDSLTVAEDGAAIAYHQSGHICERNAVVYQTDGSLCRLLEAEFVLQSPSSFGFRLKGEFDPTLAVVIDPVIDYASYVGASGSEEGYGLALDSRDNIIITGRVFSPPTLIQSPYDGTFNGGHDAYITKLSADGQTVLFSTYFGGSGMDYLMGMDLDDNDNIFVSGWTNSTDLPTANPFDDTWNGGLDGVLAKFSADGSTLLYSTYCGGSADDYFPNCAVDGEGSLFAAGQTGSLNFPLVAPFDSSYNGGQDIALVKLNPAGNMLSFASYIGSSADDYFQGLGRSLNGDFYLGAVTFAADFPLKNPVDTAFGGNNEAALIILEASMDSIVTSTFLGGSDRDNITGVFVSDDGSVYLTGSTRSSDFPGKSGYDTSLAAQADMIVAKLGPFANTIEFVTLLGGNDLDVGTCIEVDSSGAITVGGYSVSTDMPTTTAGFQPGISGLTDGFIARFSPDGSTLLYSTYVGSAGQDDMDKLVARQDGSLLFMGSVAGGDITTVNPLFANSQGGDDVFLLQMDFFCCTGVRGNLDGDATELVDISDLQAGADYMFFSGALGLCEEENDLDGAGGFDLSDLQLIIDFIFFGGALPVC